MGVHCWSKKQVKERQGCYSIDIEQGIQRINYPRNGNCVYQSELRISIECPIVPGIDSPGVCRAGIDLTQRYWYGY